MANRLPRGHAPNAALRCSKSAPNNADIDQYFEIDKAGLSVRKIQPLIFIFRWGGGIT
jgi:hypothetical protein